MFTNNHFAATRRRARSSAPFHLLLLPTILLLLLLAWSSRRETVAPRLQLAVSTAEATAIMKDNQHRVPSTSSLNMQISTSQSPASVPSFPLRIITFNIRFATTSPVLGEQPWSVRCPKLCRQLIFTTAGHDSPFVCLQEALYSQVNDVQAQLGDRWSHIGRGRDEDPQDGEFSPVFFRSDTWECLRNETKWLSETPDTPSRGWDAVLNRIVTMGLFRHKSTGSTVIVMSTHFDHIGVKARENSARLLIQLAKEWHPGAVDEDVSDPSAVLIGGDFNSEPSDGAYKVMTAKGSGMSDIADLVPEGEHYGNYLTYTSFGEPGEIPARIDFLFVKEPRSADVKTFGVLANSFDDNVRLSDHRAVIADLNISV